MGKLKTYFPLLLLTAYLAENVLLGIAPAERATWWAESLTAWIPLGVIILLYLKGLRISNTACCCMAVWFFLQTVGAHYTFEKVPFDFVTNLFNFQRNHFDRVCHFCVGRSRSRSLN